ncbi:ABC transporter permease [Micromonospora rosaria]|uniref:ABC transporter permease n=1 Tax=Micromonospora rosaria TaxID=47874 RepID=UPI000A066AB4|nr:ABC transporter permease [Micromonospora rosaria]
MPDVVFASGRQRPDTGPPAAPAGAGAAPPPRRAARRVLHRLRGALLGLSGFCGLILVWQLTAMAEIVGNGLLPTPFEVFEVIWTGLGNGLATDVLISSRRVVLWVSVGIAAAVPVGFLLGWFPTVRAALNPLVNFFRALPPIALVPLVIVYFGIGELARGIILMYAAFFATVVIVFEGVAGIEDKYVRAAQTLGATRLEVLARVVLPFSVPHILTAARVSLGIGWASLVAAELVAAQDGLGAVIQNAGNFLDIPRVYAGIILIGFCALVMDAVLRLLSARLVTWQDRGNR